jgi:hypothetical protein
LLGVIVGEFGGGSGGDPGVTGTTGYTICAYGDTGYTGGAGGVPGYTVCVFGDNGYTVCAYGDTGYTGGVFGDTGYTVCEFGVPGYTGGAGGAGGVPCDPGGGSIKMGGVTKSFVVFACVCVVLLLSSETIVGIKGEISSLLVIVLLGDIKLSIGGLFV